MQDDLLISKREILATLFRRKWSGLIIFISCVMTAGFAVYYVISPSYAADAVLILNNSFLTQPLRDAPPESDFEKLVTFHTQRDIIESTRLAIEAEAMTNLAERRVIGNIERIKMFIGDVKRDVGKILDIERWQKPWDPQAAAIGAIDDNITTAALPDSKAILVAYKAKDPQEAVDVLNAVLEAHKLYYYDVIRNKADGMVQFLQEEFDRTADALQQAEQNLVDFKVKDRINKDTLSEGIKEDEHAPSFVGITDSAKIQEELKIYILKLEEEHRVRDGAVGPKFRFGFQNSQRQLHVKSTAFVLGFRNQIGLIRRKIVWHLCHRRAHRPNVIQLGQHVVDRHGQLRRCQNLLANILQQLLNRIATANSVVQCSKHICLFDVLFAG